MPSVRPAFALLSLAANVERHKIASGQPWLLLMQIEYPGSLDIMAAQQYLRLVRNTDPVTFDAGEGLGPQVYSPFNFSIGEFNQSSNGQVPELEISASNVLRVLQTVIESFSGIVGANLTLYVVNAANPSGEPELTLDFTVKKTVCDSKTVKLTCGAPSPLRRLFPFFMYRPDSCMWQYNSPALHAATDALIAIAPAGTTAMSLRPTPPGMQCAYQGIALTGTWTTIPTSPAPTTSYITGCGDVTGVVADMIVMGPGLPDGTFVEGVDGVNLAIYISAPPPSAPVAGFAFRAILPTCTKTIDGASGCKAHNNLVRFGGFPGIDTQGAAVASVA